MKVSVIGTGYVGLVTGAGLAELGHTVTCIDVDRRKIRELEQGAIPIYEAGLEQLVQRNAHRGRLNFTTNRDKPHEEANVIIIAVGTPPKETGEVDLTFVEQAAQAIAETLSKLPKRKQRYKVIVNKSTVPIGTGDLVTHLVAKRYTGPFDVVSNPEFLREGQAVDDFFHPDRIVIGGESEKAKQTISQLYRKLRAQVLLTDVKTAEMIKYASNAFLATSVSFINAIAQVCECVGADVTKVSLGMKFDKRIGKRAFLSAGAGYGGSCFPKDVQALIAIAKENDYTFSLLQEVERINLAQQQVFMDKVRYLLPDIYGTRVALWGVAFKPGTDDVRSAPALRIIEALLSEGANVTAYDPAAVSQARKLLPDVSFAKNPYLAANNADVLLILTEWPTFQKVNFDILKRVMKQPNIVDGRNIFDPLKMKQYGFNYVSVGRQMLAPKVSIIVPTKGIDQLVLASLGKMRNLRYRNYEILVIVDRLRKAHQFAPPVRVIEGGAVSVQMKRDAALRHATGEILAFIYPGSYPHPDWLRFSTRHFQNPAVAAVGGPATSAPDQGPWEKVTGALYESILGGGSARFRYLPSGKVREVQEFPTMNLLIRKDLLHKVGGFNTTLYAGEDVEFAQRVIQHFGKKILYDPDAIVYHRHERSLGRHLQQVAAFALHRAHFVKNKSTSSLHPTYFLPSVFVLLLFATGLVGLSNLRWTPSMAVINERIALTPFTLMVAVVLLYAVLVLLTSLAEGIRRKSIFIAFFLAPAIFLTHVVYGVNFLIGLAVSDLGGGIRSSS